MSFGHCLTPAMRDVIASDSNSPDAPRIGFRMAEMFGILDLTFCLLRECGNFLCRFVGHVEGGLLSEDDHV